MKVIYLASGHGILDNDKYDITYQDKFIKRDIGGDMMKVDLSDYDIIVATPPCNYWSRANYRRESSRYALETKNLLPDILKKLEGINKPFIVENVRNKKLMADIIKNFKGYYLEYGRHSYFTNVYFDMKDFNFPKNTNHNNSSRKQRQGSGNVKECIERFLQDVNPDLLGR